MSESFADVAMVVFDMAAEDWADGPTDVEYLTSEARRREAEDAQSCVERFVELEFDPPKGQGAGRGPGAPSDTIVKTLRKQIPGMTMEDLVWLTDTVKASVAFGYVTFAYVTFSMLPEGQIPAPAPGQDPAQLWDRWMLRIASDALEKSLGGNSDTLFAIGGGYLERTLESHGITQPGLRGAYTRAAVAQLSTFYARAGMTLRLLQSTTEFDVKPHGSQVKALPNWSFEPAA